MNRKEWNKLTQAQKYYVLESIDAPYYIEANSRSSWGKLTEHVQNLLSQVNLSEVIA